MKKIILLALAAVSLTACDSAQERANKGVRTCRDGIEVIIYNANLRNEWGMVRQGRDGKTFPCGGDIAQTVNP